MDITVIGMPFNGDGTPPESENPSEALRDAGLARELTARGHRVTDLGDLPVPRFSGRRDPRTGVLNQEAWREMTVRSAAMLRHLIDPSTLVLVLGGDCSILTGVCAAIHAAGRRLGIVYVDGHADARLPLDSLTGEPADLVLTALTGRIPGLFDDLVLGGPLASDETIAVLGYRDADRIEEFGIPARSAADLRRCGVERAARDSVLPFAERCADTWLHFDVDVLDPSFMPAVMFPEGEGLDANEAGVVLTEMFATVPVLGMSVACYHPRLDPDGMGARRIVDLLVGVIPEAGWVARWAGGTRYSGSSAKPGNLVL